MEAEGTVVLTVVSSEPEAEVVCGLLRSAGIECGHRDTDAIDSSVEDFIAAGPQEILVREADLEAAKELLAASQGSSVRLDGIHHVTCITADAPRNVDFYTRVLGLRLVKKSVNQDDPTVYHLFYADEEGHAGSDITFFEYPNARPGQAGDGMVHTVVWRVGSADALEFWADRLSAEGHEVEPDAESLRFANPEGLAHELVVSHVGDEPLVARHPEIPPELALQGFEGVRAYGETSEEFLTALGFEHQDGRWDSRAETRGGWIGYEEAPEAAGIGGAGTVHHVAWASTMDEHEAWRQRVVDAGGHPTEIIDRFWFRSIYFREPGGVLFEIATLGPGFAADEDPAHLGEKLILPPSYKHLRDRVEPLLTPLPDPRASWAAR